jgi:hypothetical protein
MNKGLEIPFEVADGITLATLKQQHMYLVENNRAHLEDGQYLHPEDLGNNIKYIHAMELLIPYFGGDLK